MGRHGLALLCLAGVALVPLRGKADPPLYYNGHWQLTQYWIAQEQAAARDRRPVRILDREGGVLAWGCPRFFDELSMEGTGRTWDGRLLNWDQRVHGRACFVEVDRDAYPYGMGVSGYALIPYRSIAVDRRFIPIGHTVEITELVGMPLPDGSEHDGCFVAVDGGAAINGHHIDLFLPDESAWHELGRGGYLPPVVQHVVVDPPRCASAAQYVVVPLPGDATLPR